MKRFLILAIAALAIVRLPAHAEPRVYDATQLEALAAPFALYPDSLLSSVLAAAQVPGDVADAARRVSLEEQRSAPSSAAAKLQATQPQIGARGNGDPSPARQLQLEQQEKFQQRQQQQQKLNAAPYVPVPEARRQPIIQSDPRPQ